VAVQFGDDLASSSLALYTTSYSLVVASLRVTLGVLNSNYYPESYQKIPFAISGCYKSAMHDQAIRYYFQKIGESIVENGNCDNAASYRHIYNTDNLDCL
jgi:hypothetical protein